MTRYVPINDNLCLVQQEVKSKNISKKRQPVNHIWVYDRSGSMTWSLPELTNQMAELSKKIPRGDTLTLGWFSGQGQFNWVFKGFKISDSSDYAALRKAIKSNSTPIGLTCFSEILIDSSTVINDLSAISKIFSLHFFTDGYPVVSNYKKELEGIYSAIAAIKGKVHTAMFVGYGDYYNKDLMTKMAEKIGGMLIHNSMIPEYSNSITKLVKLTESQEPKQEIVPIISQPEAVFTLTDQGVVVHSIDDDDGKLYIGTSKDKNNVSVYYISTEKPNKKSWDRVEVDDIDFGANQDLARALYASALVLTQQTRTDIALEIMGKIGDKALIDGMTNAFTTSEYGEVENSISKSINDISNRFVSGRDPHYLPPVNAFCVFDLLNILMKDEKAAFFPYHEKFEYEKIGVSSKEKEGYSKFHADKSSKCPFDKLTWHESRLNLSIRTTIKGTIELQNIDGTSSSSIGLPSPYNTYVYRNYTFIKDGRVHTKKFFITSSEETYRFLKNKGLIFEDNFKTDGTYGVDASILPAINRAIATGNTSATKLCTMAMKEQELKAQIKSLKYLKKEEVGEEPFTKPPDLTDEQVQFLISNGIRADKDGSYNPPRNLEESKDKYLAKAFEIKIAGMSSLPGVKKVRDKIASNKARTPVESLLEKGISTYTNVQNKLASNEDKSAWFDKTIKELQNQLNDIRSKLQQTKFSIILGKKGFEEFNSREDCELEVNGIKYRFNLKEEAVDI